MKKTLKESIQKTVKVSILKEKWTDAPAAVASGVANSFRNIGGQYGLGKIQNRLDRVGARIEKDWNDSAEEAARTGQKLAKSKNPMIAQQGQAFLQKIDGIEQSMDRTLKMFDVPVGQGQPGQEDENADFNDMEEGKKFNLWLKKVWHGDPDRMTATETEKARAVYNQINSYGIDPLSPQAKLGPVQKLIDHAKAQEQVHRNQVDKHYGLSDDGSSTDKKGQKKLAVQAMVGAWKKKNPNATKQEKEAFKQKIKAMIKGQGEVVPSGANPAPQIAPKPPGKENEVEAARRQMGVQNSGPANPNVVRPPGLDGSIRSKPPAAGGVVPPPGLTGSPAKPAVQPAAPQEPSVPNSIKSMVGDGNWGDPETINKKQPAAAPAQMQSPANVKGQASPPPLPPNPNPYQSVEPPAAPIPLTKKKEAAPVPLTNLKPVPPKASATAAASFKPEPESIQMPPEDDSSAVPSSIKGMLPPIKDDGNEIQVGSSDQPSFKPTEDNLRTRKSPPIEKLKSRAEKTRDPEHIKAYTDALAKEVTSKKPPQKKK